MSHIVEINPHTYLIDAFYYAYPGRGCVYLVKYDDEAALIDTGTGMSVVYIMDALQKLGVAPEGVRYVLPTHVHLDHAGGAGALALRLPNARVYVHPRGLRHLIDPVKLVAGSRAIYGENMMAKAIGEVVPVPQEKGFEAVDNMELPLANKSIKLLFSPGHAHHHYSVWDPNSGCYFAGDVGGNSYRDMDKDGKHLMFLCSAPVQYDPEAWHSSLDAISQLDPKKMCICHYGVLDNVRQALTDMHRLLDEVNKEALKCKSAMDKYHSLEKIMWDSFWREYDTLSPPMERLHAELWMKKDVHISTAGLENWISR